MTVKSKDKIKKPYTDILHSENFEKDFAELVEIAKKIRYYTRLENASRERTKTEPEE